MKFSPFDTDKMLEKQKIKINPVCLPESSFPDEDKVGFVIGMGLNFQKTCRTNGGGPEIYKACAPGMLNIVKGSLDKILLQVL